MRIPHSGHVLAPLAAGAVATITMTTVFTTFAHTAAMPEEPPVTITRGVLPILPERWVRPVAAVAHLGYGVAFAVMFARTLAGRISTPWDGVLLGIGVWAAGYEGWLPAARILPPAHRDFNGRAVVVVAAHLVYGVTLSITLAKLRVRSRTHS